MTHQLEIRTTYKNNDVWLAPDGEFYEGRAHSLYATYIVKQLYNRECDDFGMYTSEDFLIKHGWVKLTTSAMMEYYAKDGMYDHLTEIQESAKSLWEAFHTR